MQPVFSSYYINSNIPANQSTPDIVSQVPYVPALYMLEEFKKHVKEQRN